MVCPGVPGRYIQIKFIHGHCQDDASAVGWLLAARNARNQGWASCAGGLVAWCVCVVGVVAFVYVRACRLVSGTVIFLPCFHRKPKGTVKPFGQFPILRLGFEATPLLGDLFLKILIKAGSDGPSVRGICGVSVCWGYPTKNGRHVLMGSLENQPKRIKTGSLNNRTCPFGHLGRVLVSEHLGGSLFWGGNQE